VAGRGPIDARARRLLRTLRPGRGVEVVAGSPPRTGIEAIRTHDRLLKVHPIIMLYNIWDGGSNLRGCNRGIFLNWLRYAHQPDPCWPAASLQGPCWGVLFYRQTPFWNVECRGGPSYVVHISSDEVGSTKCAKQAGPGRDGFVNECVQRSPRYVFDYAGNDIAPKAFFLGGQSLLNLLLVVCLDRYIRKTPASAVGAI
jgi:hypothetical protein